MRPALVAATHSVATPDGFVGDLAVVLPAALSVALPEILAAAPVCDPLGGLSLP